MTLQDKITQGFKRMSDDPPPVRFVTFGDSRRARQRLKVAIMLAFGKARRHMSETDGDRADARAHGDTPVTRNYIGTEAAIAALLREPPMTLPHLYVRQLPREHVGSTVDRRGFNPRPMLLRATSVQWPPGPTELAEKWWPGALGLQRALVGNHMST